MPFLLSRLALAGAILSPVFAAQVHAQSVPDPDTKDILIVGQHAQDTLTTPNGTGSRLGLTPLETPATISVIDGATIRARGDLSVIDATSRAPGISNAGNPGNGGTALAARGFSGQGSVLQLIDGIRLFPAAGTITFPTDPWMVERIDILSGPASVLYGQGALGGAVNVVMRKPDTQQTHVEGEIGYGSQDSFHLAAGAGGRSPSASPTVSTAAIVGPTAMSIVASRAAMPSRARFAGHQPTRSSSPRGTIMATRSRCAISAHR
ncbi:TonB-dependent receptor plug domain-containing protein [Sphingomonas aerolata]|uniref:TonB-dependent receptor plug domain-containing protein n=1 Tax=Sphingomonas aerolata TaxID=185951 RepID=UPI0035A674A0